MNFQKAIDLINKSKNILITTHSKPDGDACGCAAAMAEGLNAIGKDVSIVLLSEAPDWYEFLFERKPRIYTEDENIEADLIIFGDVEFNKELNNAGFELSSANSINWGRLVPQIVYYFYRGFHVAQVYFRGN